MLVISGAARRIRRAALYVRVSTDRQVQLRQVTERRGWEIVEVYNDAAISGAKDWKQRPDLDRMLNDASLDYCQCAGSSHMR